MSPNRALPLLQVFSEAREWGRGGEVVVRCGAETGRIFFVGGKIAWAAASTHKHTFLSFLIERTDLTKAQLQEAFEACKQSGQNFGETLVERGLLAEDSLRQLLLQHLSECLFEVLCWSSLESMFVPEERSYKGSLIFRVDEVLQSVIDLDTDGRLPFSGMTAEVLLREVAQGADRLSPVRTPDPASPRSRTTRDSAAAVPLPRFARTPSPTLGSPTDSNEPDGQFVTVDASEARRWRSGRGRLIAIGAGSLVVLAALVGFLVYRVVKVRSRRPASTGQVRVASTPSGAKVFLDGVASGETPAQIDRVEPGRKYALRVALDGWEAWETRFVLTDTGRPLQFEALLRKAPAKPDPPGDSVPRPTSRGARPEPRQGSTAGKQVRRPEQPSLPVVSPEAKGKGTGSVLIASRPPHAEIYLDGRRTGKKTPAALRVPAGLVHVVQVSLKGYTAVETVKPAKNKITKLKLVLKKKPRKENGTGPVMLDSVPRGAAVLINGKRMKQVTPVNLTLSQAKLSKVEVRHKGYKPWTRTMNAVPGVKLSFTAHLQKAAGGAQRKSKRPRHSR